MLQMIGASRETHFREPAPSAPAFQSLDVVLAETRGPARASSVGRPGKSRPLAPPALATPPAARSRTAPPPVRTPVHADPDGLGALPARAGRPTPQGKAPCSAQAATTGLREHLERLGETQEHLCKLLQSGEHRTAVAELEALGQPGRSLALDMLVDVCPDLPGSVRPGFEDRLAQLAEACAPADPDGSREERDIPATAAGGKTAAFLAERREDKAVNDWQLATQRAVPRPGGYKSGVRPVPPKHDSEAITTYLQTRLFTGDGPRPGTEKVPERGGAPNGARVPHGGHRRTTP